MRFDGLGALLGFFLVAVAATLGYLVAQYAIAPRVGLR